MNRTNGKIVKWRESGKVTQKQSSQLRVSKGQGQDQSEGRWNTGRRVILRKEWQWWGFGLSLQHRYWQKRTRQSFTFLRLSVGGSRVYGKLLQLTCYRDTDLFPWLFFCWFHSLKIIRDLQLGGLCSIIDSSWKFFSWLIFSLTTYMYSDFLFLLHHSPLSLSFSYHSHHASLSMDSSFPLCFKFAVSLNCRFSR